MARRLAEVRDVEFVVEWALARAGGGGHGRFGPPVATRSADGVARGMEIMALGCQPDCGGSAARFVAVSAACPDAEAVVEAVDRLDDLPRLLVAKHGRTGTRPDWKPWGAYWRAGTRDRTVRWRPGGRLRPVMEYDSNRNPSYCPIVIVDEPDNVAAAREFYRLWRSALVAVVSALDGRLSQFHVSGPAVPARPWEDAAIVSVERQLRPVLRGFPSRDEVRRAGIAV